MTKKSLTTLGVTAAVLGLLLTGCASADKGGATTAASASLRPEAAAAADVVAAHTGPVDEFTAPGPAVDGSALAGATVYFIPATLQVPLLNIIAESLTAALADVGANVQICDAKANPSDAASCISQAIDAKAGAVVTAGLTPDFAPTAFDDLVASGIPWVQGLTAPAGDADPTKVAYVTSDNVLMQSWATDWVIADSNAAGHVLIITLTDTPATTAWADAGIIATYASGCPDCTTQVIEINSGQTDKLPSLISSALVADPDITYIQSQFDQFLPAIQQGVQAAGRDDISVNSVDGLLSTLQDIQSGGMVRSVVAFNQTALAWYMADAAIRLAAGTAAVQNLDFPFRRIFTEANTQDLTLTDAAAASGEWFGTADYQAGFLTLWGVD